MRVSLNCKKVAVDMGGNYRNVFPARAFAPKSFDAEMTVDEISGDVIFIKDDDRREILISPRDIVNIRFFLDDDRPYAEFVREKAGKPMSFVCCPVEDNIELGQQGVFAFREALDFAAAPANVSVEEYIDPNPLGICPDGVDSMEELIAIREAEMSQPAFDDEIDELDLSVFATVEDEPAATVEVEPAGFVIDDVSEPEKVNEVLDDYADSLDNIKDKIEAEKARREEEIAILVGPDDFEDDFASEPGDQVVLEEDDDDDYDPKYANEYIVEGIADIEDSEIPAISNLLDKISESDLEDRADISERLVQLDSAARKIGATLDDYDEILDQTRSEQALYLSKLNESMEEDGISGSTTVAGLVRMLQEQTETSEALNEKFKKERIERRHCIEQLDEANRKLEEQSAALDEVRRRLRFSQENQRKSEKFVADARAEVRRIIADTSQKVAAALESVEEMKRQVELKTLEVEESRVTTNQALEAKQLAEAAQDELRAKFVEEQANNERMAQEFARQLDDFTNDTVSKIKAQIERADAAERKYAEKTVKIAELESALAEACNIADQAEINRNEAESNLLDARETYQALIDEYEALKKSHDRRGEALEEANAKLAAAEHDYAELDRSFATFKDENSMDVEDLKRQMSADYAELQSKYEEQVSLTAAAEAALAASQDKVASMTSDFNDLQTIAEPQQVDLNSPGNLPNQAETELVGAKAEIAQLNQEIEDMRNGYEARIADMIAHRSAVDVANDRFIGEISQIVNMPASFGGRKKKLDALENVIDSYFDEFTSAKKAALESELSEAQVDEPLVHPVDEEPLTGLANLVNDVEPPARPGYEDNGVDEYVRDLGQTQRYEYAPVTSETLFDEVAYKQPELDVVNDEDLSSGEVIGNPEFDFDADAVGGSIEPEILGQDNQDLVVNADMEAMIEQDLKVEPEVHGMFDVSKFETAAMDLEALQEKETKLIDPLGLGLVEDVEVPETLEEFDAYVEDASGHIGQAVEVASPVAAEVKEAVVGVGETVVVAPGNIAETVKTADEIKAVEPVEVNPVKEKDSSLTEVSEKDTAPIEIPGKVEVPKTPVVKEAESALDDLAEQGVVESKDNIVSFGMKEPHKNK